MLPVDLKRYLVLLGWGAARSLPMVWLIPAFGGPRIPVQMRLALGLGLSGLCLPLLSGRAAAGATMVAIASEQSRMAWRKLASVWDDGAHGATKAGGAVGKVPPLGRAAPMG